MDRQQGERALEAGDDGLHRGREVPGLPAPEELIDTYAVKVDPVLHKEVLARYAKLNIAPYAGFIQPRLVPVERDGRIIDVKLEYPEDFAQQMLEYGRKYKTLPDYN